MKKLFLIGAGVASLCACKPAEAPPADNAAVNDMMVDENMAGANMADANMAAATTGVATASLNETSWEFTMDGKAMQESIDAKGAYITQSGKEHIDHGTAVMKDGKACFTSAMNKDGEVCWTDPMLAEGQSGETTNDKGEKLTIKRVAYTPMTM